MHATPETTIRDIVAADFRAAAVFQKHAIDFCCKGQRSLAAACGNGPDVTALIDELERACAPGQPGSPRFATWTLSALISYIVENHHRYVQEAIPVLLAHTDKIARVHGGNHPELREVAALFVRVAAEMRSHMMKEEQVLFPFVLELERSASGSGRADAPCFGSVANPIRAMEMEHESAGDAMARIRELTAGFAPPEGACTTYRVCLQELEAFEQDLHSHVHLENNILFPRALRLEAELSGAAAR